MTATQGTWYPDDHNQEPTPIHDSTSTGEIPQVSMEPVSIERVTYNSVQTLQAQVDQVAQQLNEVLGILDTVVPLIQVAQTYLSGSKMEKARLALGLKNGRG